MRYNIILQPGAEEDINDAYNWYEDKQPGLGDLLLKDLVIVYKTLQQNPELYSKLTKRYRQAHLIRFPYVVVYAIEEPQVHIYAVFHTSRNPKNKLKSR